MDFEKIISELEEAQKKKFVRFVSDKGPNSCQKCLQQNGKVYEENDPDKPTLPIHPHCRCHYETVANPRLENIKANLMQMVQQMQESARQLSAKASEFIAEAMKLLEKIKSVKGGIDSTIAAAKISAIIISLQLVLAAMIKLKNVATELQNAMRRIGLEPVNPIDALKDFDKNIVTIKEILKELHYTRLKEPDQNADALPQSPEEAKKRGFIKAPDDQNRYHRNKGETGNVKYYHPVTGQEVVFDKNGKIVTSPENRGTKNYGSNPKSLEHVIYDVIPYWIWGNSEDDTTPFWDRIWGTGK